MYFTHRNLTLSFRILGTGPLPIIAFHGFGRTGRDFHAFEQTLGDIATIHAFDLPFHGESPSPSERADLPFEPAELCAYFSAFAESIGATQFVVMGYSLGGRVALSLLETMPERIARAVLIAPDGLHADPWYRRMASSAWGRACYEHFIDHPGRVLWIVNTLRSLRLLNEKLHRFILGQTDTREKRLLLRNVWLSFRHLEPDLHHVASTVKQNHIPVFLVFGAKDSVIKPELADNLRPLAPKMISTLVIDAGHQLLTPELGLRLKDLP